MDGLKKAVDGIIEASNKKGFNPEDYLNEDGLMVCGKCHTPKQGRYNMSFIGRGIVVQRCNCKCEDEAYKERERKEEEKRQFERIGRMKADGVQDRNILNWTFANDDGTNPKMEYAHKYVDNWEKAYADNLGLIVFGDVGTGKTFFSACIANALLDKAVPVLVTSFPRLLNELQGLGNDKNAYINSLNNYKLLVIDDLGVERTSDYAMEQVYNVIDARYKNGQPLIITTNLSIDDLKNSADMRYKRIYDRILEMCMPMQMTGASRRQRERAEKMKRAAELFA